MTDRLQVYFEYIEGEEFRIKTLAFPTLYGLNEAFAADHQIIALIMLLLSDSRLAPVVYEEGQALRGQAHDPNYRSPFDAAMAAYLYVLQIASPGYARMLATLMFTRDVFWARRMAAQLLETTFNLGLAGSTIANYSLPIFLETPARNDKDTSSIGSITEFDKEPQPENAASMISLLVTQPYPIVADIETISIENSTQNDLLVATSW